MKRTLCLLMLMALKVVGSLETVLRRVLAANIISVCLFVCESVDACERKIMTER